MKKTLKRAKRKTTKPILSARRPAPGRLRELESQIAAVSRAQVMIEFTLDGFISTANENFLTLFGYALEEVKGKHHSMFVQPDDRDSMAYKQFWEKLQRGEFDAGQYKRLGRNGKEVWIQATYSPILDRVGKPYKIVKFATDISAGKCRTAEFEGQLEAVQKSQAVIEFRLDGTILTANDNFLKTVGYSLEDVKDKHHSMFVEPEYRASVEYQLFWEKLRRGEFDAAQYKRIGCGGKEVWIQASYNPILDLNGKPYKVVKYATDVTPLIMMQKALDSAVQETQSIVQAAVDGELTLRITTENKSGPLLSLSTSVNSLVDTMMNVVKQIKTTAAEVSMGAEEISKGSLNLSQRTEGQASSLEETAASMEEMTSTVKHNAENASEANQLATAARRQAESGGAVVSSAVQAMQEINKSSKRIADIIGVIDEIAFQTNLLALNAAVEAARAGEQGRGFAVVASEVRNLAGRSATAAKEIKSLIQDSVNKVDEGSKLVDQSGAALGAIVTSVKKVSDIVAEISAASREQSTGIEQVNKAVMQMDEVTQQNAALVEQAAAAAEALTKQARNLASVIGRFNVGRDETVSAMRRESPPVAVNRRGSDRPWNKPNAVGALPELVSTTRPLDDKTYASVGNDSGWSEF